jgi:hypothetical protein
LLHRGGNGSSPESFLKLDYVAVARQFADRFVLLFRQADVTGSSLYL